MRIASDQRFVVFKDIAEKSSNRLLLLLLLKNSKLHRKPPALESLFSKVAGLNARKFLKKRLQRRYFFSGIWEILKSIYFEVYLWTSVSVSSDNFINNSWKRYSQRGVIRTLWHIYYEVFLPKQLTASSPYQFSQKFPSQIFGVVLNTPLSHKLSICYYNTNDNKDPSNKY